MKLLLPAILATTEAVSQHGQSSGQTLAVGSNMGKDTPVTRVVNLLKEMTKTVKAEMEEDDSLYRKLKCWCNDNSWDKAQSIEKSEAKIQELETNIEELTGTTGELRASIKSLEAEFTKDKKSLKEATALREKQLDEFSNFEKDSIQAIENMKAALTVLAKTQDQKGGPNFKTERDSWESFLQVSSKGFPSRLQRAFDDFLRHAGLDSESNDDQSSEKPTSKFLQQGSPADASWSTSDTEVVERALRSASAFVQSGQGQQYYPAYAGQSDGIIGILKQMKEEMETALDEAQKEEKDRAADFVELRAAKTEEIESGEKMAEEKEDQLAKADNELAECKEDLPQEKASLAADQKFVKNLEKTCGKADEDFEERKSMRIQELKALAETMTILTGDEARDAMTSTFSFVQVGVSHKSLARMQAASTLRRAAKDLHSEQLTLLATSVELDAFTKVKKAIDDMVVMLKQEQEDEVKKNDWCKVELQENEMSAAKKSSTADDLNAKIDELDSTIKTLGEEIADAKSAIQKNYVELQRASQTRKQENYDFQKLIGDQTVTIEVLKKALDKLATFYDLAQTGSGSWIQKQTPPVPQMEYSKNSGASGVMEMIEKLIYDSQELQKESRKAESDAQAAYEELIADTNDSVHALQKEVTTKSATKLDKEKDLRNAQSDLSDTMKSLDSLQKYNAELHEECDYILKNFDTRQQNRQAEIASLQEAKQILNGASMS